MGDTLVLVALFNRVHRFRTREDRIHVVHPSVFLILEEA